MLDSIYNMTLKLFKNRIFWCKNFNILHIHVIIVNDHLNYAMHAGYEWLWKFFFCPQI